MLRRPQKITDSSYRNLNESCHLGHAPPVTQKYGVLERQSLPLHVRAMNIDRFFDILRSAQSNYKLMILSQE